MVSQTQSVNNFVNRCDEVIQSNYVLATKKISELLKCLTSSRLFMELFEHLLTDFDYEASKAKATKVKSFEGGGFVVPQNRSEFLALTFSLLCEIDMERINLIDFMMLYFNGGGYKESYNCFCREIIAPFKSELLFVVKQMQNPSALDERIVTVKQVKPIFEKDELVALDELLRSSKAIVFQYKMESSLKRDLLALYDDFYNALYGNDAYRIKIAFLGYKYSTLYQRKLDTCVKKIEKILLKKGILDD